jgi:hypothetical protein
MASTRISNQLKQNSSRMEGNKVNVRYSLFISLVFFIISPQAFGKFISGNDLLKQCSQTASNLDQAICLGYVTAISDVLMSNKVNGFQGCTPSGATMGQLQRVIHSWLVARPNVLHYPASGLVASALEDAFPCNKQ